MSVANLFKKHYLPSVAVILLALAIGIAGLIRASGSSTIISANNTRIGNVLTVSGPLYASSTMLIDGEITVTSLTATSTFPYLAATYSDLGTIIGGVWRGDFEVESENYHYTATNSPFKRGGINYYMSGDASVIWAIKKDDTWHLSLFEDGVFMDDGTLTGAISSLDQTIGSLNVFLVDGGDGSQKVTIVTNETFDNVKAYMDANFGLNLSNESGTEGIGAYSFSSPNYTFNMPNGWSVADNSATTTWVNPPTLTGTPTPLFAVDHSTGNVTLTGDLTNLNSDADLTWKGKVTFSSLSSSQIGVNDYGLFVSKATATTSAGVYAGLGFSLIATNNTDSQGIYLGVFGQTIVSGKGNYTGPFVGFFSSLVIGGSGDKTLSEYDGFGFFPKNGSEGGGSTTINNLYQFKGSTLSGFSGAGSNVSVVNNYGIIIPDNTAYVTGGSWGIFNLDRTYLGRNVGIGADNPTALLHISSSTAATLFQVDDSGADDLSPFIIDGDGNVAIGSTSPAITSPVNSLSIAGLMYVGGSGTSTIENNLDVLGGFHAGQTYVNDLIFKNNFRFSESQTNEGLRLLALFSPNGNPALMIDEEGKVAVTNGVVEIGGDNKPACLKLKDNQGDGWTYCTVFQGTMSCSVVPCAAP